MTTRNATTTPTTPIPDTRYGSNDITPKDSGNERVGADPMPDCPDDSPRCGGPDDSREVAGYTSEIQSVTDPSPECQDNPPRCGGPDDSRSISR